MYQIAGHTMGTPEYTISEALELFAEMGLDGAELVVQDDYRSGIPTNATEADLAGIRAKADSLGLRIACLTPYYSKFNDLDDAVRAGEMDGLKRIIGFAASLGAGSIRVYGGNFAQGEIDPDGRKRERLVTAMRELGDVARKEGVTLAIENHFNTMTVSAAQTASVVDEIAHPAVGILYDQANLAFTFQEDYREAIPLQKGRIAHVHVKDLVFKGTEKVFIAGSVSHQKADERTVATRIVGEGVLDWPGIIALLGEADYASGWLSLEYERRWHPQDIPDASEGMRKSAEYLRTVLKSAKTTAQ